MAGRRYYWLKLPEDFFRRSYIRRLRGMENGDRLTLIYLEMLLASLKTGGALTADGAEDFAGDFAEELALELYEDSAEVQTVLEYLMDRGKIAHENGEEYYLTDCEEMTGCESADAQRMRRSRQRKIVENGAVSTVPAQPSVPVPAMSGNVSDADFARCMASLRRS